MTFLRIPGIHRYFEPEVAKIEVKIVSKWAQITSKEAH